MYKSKVRIESLLLRLKGTVSRDFVQPNLFALLWHIVSLIWINFKKSSINIFKTFGLQSFLHNWIINYSQKYTNEWIRCSDGLDSWKRVWTISWHCPINKKLHLICMYFTAPIIPRVYCRNDPCKLVRIQTFLESLQYIVPGRPYLIFKHV